MIYFNSSASSTSSQALSEALETTSPIIIPIQVAVKKRDSLSDPKDCCEYLYGVTYFFKKFCKDIWRYLKSCFFSRNRYKLPKLQMKKLFDRQAIDNMRKNYWALKEKKWMEVIDGEYHHLGREVFDKALHERTKEPGYISSMENYAFPLIAKYLGTRTTSSFFLEVHKAACWHFNGSSNGTLMGLEKVGLFRDEEDHIHCNYSNNIPSNDEEWRGFLNSGLGEIHYTNDEKSSIRMNYRLMSPEKIKGELDQFFDEFYQEIQGAVTKQQKILAIARLSQRMDWLHPPRDGSTRSCILILQKHLTEYMGHPGIFKYPHRMTTRSLNKWANFIEQALSCWEKVHSEVSKSE